MTAPIRFRIRFGVAPDRSAALVELLRGPYTSALRRQAGFRGVAVMQPYSAEASSAIGAVTATDSWEIEFDFDSEGARLGWTRDPAHDELWNAACAVSTSQEWRGFEIEEAA
jgi:hypothetical protein